MYLYSSLSPGFRHFLKHFLILIAFCCACFLLKDQISPYTPRLGMPHNQDQNEEMVQNASSCTIERQFDDLRHLKISCRMQRQRPVPPAHRRNMIFVVPTIPKHQRRQWNLNVPVESIVGLEELTAKAVKSSNVYT